MPLYIIASGDMRIGYGSEARLPFHIAEHVDAHRTRPCDLRAFVPHDPRRLRRPPSTHDHDHHPNSKCNNAMCNFAPHPHRGLGHPRSTETEMVDNVLELQRRSQRLRRFRAGWHAQFERRLAQFARRKTSVDLDEDAMVAMVRLAAMFALEEKSDNFEDLVSQSALNERDPFYPPRAQGK